MPASPSEDFSPEALEAEQKAAALAAEKKQASEAKNRYEGQLHQWRTVTNARNAFQRREYSQMSREEVAGVFLKEAGLAFGVLGVGISH